MSLRGSSVQTTTGSSITISLPAGAAAGDLAILFVGFAYVYSVPSGWTSLYDFNTGIWGQFAASKVLSSGDISTGSVTISGAGPYDACAALVVFVGGTYGGVRETEGAQGASGAAGNVTNTMTSAVLSSDRALYFASSRTTNAAPTINPASGSATTLQAGSTANSQNVLADQVPPGGSMAVVNTFTSGTAYGAVQVIVEENAPSSGGLLSNPGMDGGMHPQLRGGING